MWADKAANYERLMALFFSSKQLRARFKYFDIGDTRSWPLNLKFTELSFTSRFFLKTSDLYTQTIRFEC